MDIEDQKFMALEGVHTWASATLTQIARMEQMAAEMLRPTPGRIAAARSFQAERHLFLIAAHKLVEHVRWLDDLAFVPPAALAEAKATFEEVKIVRDMNEHVVEYFQGGGRKRGQWEHGDQNIMADASSTIGTKIANRLDWTEFGAIVTRLQAALPAHYFSPSPRTTPNQE